MDIQNDRFFPDSLKVKEEYIKLRSDLDSKALKIRFSNKSIYNKNYPWGLGQPMQLMDRNFWRVEGAAPVGGGRSLVNIYL